MRLFRARDPHARDPRGRDPHARDPQLPDTHSADRARMVEEQLRARGIKSEAVLEVMGRSSGSGSSLRSQGPQAYQDRALPLRPRPDRFPTLHGRRHDGGPQPPAFRQSLGDRNRKWVPDSQSYRPWLPPSSPSNGSASCLRWPTRCLSELACENVRLRVGDGTVGWPEEAPFDAILVTAGAPGVPESLLAQLAVGGRLVAPVGDRSVQELVLVTRTKEGHDTEKLLSCRFVPLIGEEGWESG